jgi:hypothetical protein
LSSARVLIQPATGELVQKFTNPQGQFRLELPTGVYKLIIERDGYFPLRDYEIRLERTDEEGVFILEPVREVRETLHVSASPLSIDMDTSSAKRSIGDRQIINVPYPNTNDFRSVLRIIPGVIRDSRGGLHVNGASEEQLLFTLNGFNVNDPLTGRFETRFSVESVHSVEITSGNLPAEYGKGSAGALAVRTHSGDDKFRYSATNFVPGIENRKGWTIGDWTPRLNISGPIRRGSAWFSNSFDTQYVKNFIRDLPKGQDRTSSLRFSNLLHTQWNVRPSHIVYAGFLSNHWNAPRTGLTALDPVETTIDRRARQWFFHAKDQITLRSRAVVEIGFASNRTFGREIPQGEGLLRIRPEGKRGNFFSDATRKAARDQILINGFLPSFTLSGSHQMKTGADLNRLSYWQDVHRTGYENFSESGNLVSRTLFFGDGKLRRGNYEATYFLQDSWRVRPGLLVEAGIRTDWGRLVRRWSPSPRLGIAWSPPRMENTKLYGGIARIYDASSLRLFTRPMDQYTLTSYFSQDGTVGRGPALSLFRILNEPFDRPRYHNWTAGIEHHWPGRFAMRIDAIRRRGDRGFTYRNSYVQNGELIPLWARELNARHVDAVYTLDNFRQDSFDSITFTVRQNLRRQYEWMASYTRSRALSNAVVDVNIDDPIVVTDNAGPMPWDAPHRFLGWGYLPLPLKHWSIAYLLDARNGFPFSARREDGRLEGKVNDWRFPYFFEMNVHLERKLVFRGHRWALRVGANNVTDRINPETVVNTIGSSRFLRFYGGNGRSFNFRIRWLGRI